MGGLLGLGPCFSASAGPARPLFPSLTFNLEFKAHLPMHDSLICDELLWLAGNQSLLAPRRGQRMQTIMPQLPSLECTPCTHTTW